MTDLTSLTLAEARSGLAGKSFTSLELTDAHLAAIEAARSLNVFVMETPDRARSMARQADAKIASGAGGPLAGIPLGIKDLFATRDVRTTACSRILGNFVPTYESTVTSQLWRDGAVLLGKLNNDEFAMGSSNETSAFGPVISPWRRRGSNTPLVPGGSSGGSAAAVAAMLCAGAVGTDTGGSIKGMRIGIPKEYRLDRLAADVDQLWQRGAQWLQAAGAELVEISLPHTKYALPAYYIVAPAEASSNLARYDGVRYGLRVPGRDIIDMYQKSRATGFGREGRRRIMIGTDRKSV